MNKEIRVLLLEDDPFSRSWMEFLIRRVCFEKRNRRQPGLGNRAVCGWQYDHDTRYQKQVAQTLLAAV